jgi:hypothetical protein
MAYYRIYGYDLRGVWEVVPMGEALTHVGERV